MATYLKRTSKLFDDSLSRSTANVNLRDLMCPVCRGILIEPVTLPCTHNLCLRCLNGTFEHNSLTCPLCRVRVGSWLRNATKTETLVNNGLWELIRTKFSKEVENKQNNIEEDIEFSTRKILNAAGEIRKEYEAQLQMAEEEMRRRRQAEEIASQAFIRKIQVEEQQQQFVQLVQDQLLAKTLAKKEITDKGKELPKYRNDCTNASMKNHSVDILNYDIKPISVLNINSSKMEGPSLEAEKANLSGSKDTSDFKRSNIALISKIRAERYTSKVKPNSSNISKESSVKFCYQKPMPVYNTITRTLKHQAVTKFTQPSTSNYSLNSGCSTSKIYGMQSKEELHVPSDVLSSKKKSLGVEVCMTVGDGDERIGSAESAGSHDSINQEIHHFKPIKAMPRTPLKTSIDGKQIDPKLMRVVPILKQVSNAVPKPPSSTNLKRIIGCSWSAFRGKARQDLKIKESLSSSKEVEDEIEQKPSTSLVQSHIVSNKTVKSQAHDVIRRLDFVPELSFNKNKNCSKNVNKVLNGTKVSKRLNLDEQVVDSEKFHKSWKSHVKNGTMSKCKKQKSVWTMVADYEESNDDLRDIVSSTSVKETLECDEHTEHNDLAIENIAERIKKRKVGNDKRCSQEIENSKSKVELTVTKRSTRKRILDNKPDESCVNNVTSAPMQKRVKRNLSNTTKVKNRRGKVSKQAKSNTDNYDPCVETDYKIILSGLRKSNRNGKLTIENPLKNDYKNPDQKITVNSHDSNLSNSCNEMHEYVAENNNDNDLEGDTDKNTLSDDDAIKEQERIERLLVQEKEDFELAQRLQAKFNEMERIAGRTRRSRKAVENGTLELDLYQLKVGRTVHKVTGAHTAKRSTIDQTMNTKQRGRPRKGIK